MVEYENRWTLPDWHSALLWSRARNGQAIRAVIDILGEGSGEEETQTNADSYLEVIRSITREGLDAGISVKVTQLGFPRDREGCIERVLMLARDTAARRIGFEIDMEGRSTVDFTLEVVEACASENYPVTLALQVYLDRTEDDLERVVEHGVRVRVVKGAYAGDTKDFREIQNRFKKMVQRLIVSGDEFCIGTHDPELIAWGSTVTAEISDRVEFGLLKGLSDQTKVEFAGKGWKVSEYVPFGDEKAAYEDRRRAYIRELEKIGREPAP